MNELLEAQKVILKQKTQEAVELFESEKRRIKERHKMYMALNAFIGGVLFALTLIGVRDKSAMVALWNIAGCVYCLWCVKMTWGYDDEPKTEK